MGVRRGEEEALAIGKEPAAGRLSFAIRHSRQSAAVDAHHVLLVAGASVACRLKRQPLTIAAEIRLGVFSTKRDLADRGEMALAVLLRYVAALRRAAECSARSYVRRGCACIR